MSLKKAIGQAAVLVLLSAGAALAVHTWHPRAPALHLIEEPLRDNEVSLASIRDQFQYEVLWIDARPKDLFDAEHVPGALLLNEQGFDEQLLGHLEVLQTNTKPIVVYCGGQKCEASRKVAQKLQQMGIVQKAWVLKGGFGAWQAGQ
jgi:rhodanese-related sulfurtransferase